MIHPMFKSSTPFRCLLHPQGQQSLQLFRAAVAERSGKLADALHAKLEAIEISDHARAQITWRW